MAKKKTTEKQLDKETLRKEYEEVRPKYERLAINIKQALEIFIDEAGIEVFSVRYRIKDFDSFWEKIGRKGYDDPFNQIEDICGLRVICLYDSDIKNIAKLVEKEFASAKLKDKRDELEPNQFGYRSLQGPVEIPKEWLKAPNYRGLKGLKSEIQIRTILMHAWAEIQHKLVYKKGTYPEEMEKEFGFISSKLEEADGQFVGLRKAREEYREEMAVEAEDKGKFDVNQPMNIDTLQALLDYYFPNRELTEDVSDFLYKNIADSKLTIKDIVGEISDVGDDIYDYVDKWLDIIKKRKYTVEADVILHILLCISNDDYWAKISGRLMPVFFNFIEDVRLSHKDKR